MLYFGPFEDNLDLDVDVSMQMHFDLVLAHHTQRSVWQPDFAAFDFRAQFAEGLCNVDRADRSEQTPFTACLHGNGQILAFNQGSARASCIDFGCFFRFEFGSDFLEFLDVLSRCHRRFPLRYQEIPRVTRLHLHAITNTADVLNLFKQNNFHIPLQTQSSAAARPRKAKKLSSKPTALKPRTTATVVNGKHNNA